MADRRHIEPYNREIRGAYRQHSHERTGGSRGGSIENRKEYEHSPPQRTPQYERQSQERHHREIHRPSDQDYPPSILRRRDLEHERPPHGEHMARSYGHHVHMSHSRSPPRAGFRSDRSHSPHHHHHPDHKSPTSPLRELSNSPPHAPPFVAIDDPVERRSLLVQLDELKHRLHHNYAENNNEINEVRRHKESEIQQILSKKDALVEESHFRIQCLKKEIEEEERKAERIREGKSRNF